MSCEKILIAGFSGAGKTSLMRELESSAPDSTWDFSDLDQLILNSHGSAEVASLIEQHGWEKFRLWERQELEAWLKKDGPGVLSLGGGTLNSTLVQLYKPIKKIKFCFLHSTFEDCWDRLHLEGTEPRPLVKLGKGELHRLYEERQKIFQEISWRLENPEGQPLSETAMNFWKIVLSS